MKRKRTAVLAAMWIVVGLLVPVFTDSAYLLGVGALVITYAVLSQSLNMVYGYAGYLSLAQTGMWGIGGYATARLVLSFEISPWVGFLVGAIIASVFAILLGYASMRGPRYSFVVVTLVFLLALGLVSKHLTSVTNGPRGLAGLPIPDIEIFGWQIRLGTPTSTYYSFLVIGIVLLALMYWILSSRWGRTLTAINRDEDLAAAQGINVLRNKVVVFAASAFFAGLIGGMHVFRLTIVDPTVFGVVFLAPIVAAVLLGGPGSFWGVLTASVIITAIPEGLRRVGNYRLLVYGLVLVFGALLFPNGVAAAIDGFRARKRASRSAGADTESQLSEVSG